VLGAHRRFLDGQPTMRTSLALAALRHRLRDPAGTFIVQLHRGSEFRSHPFVCSLHDNGLSGSMGRVGACVDSASMQWLSGRRRTSLTPAAGRPTTSTRLALITWIERTFQPPASNCLGKLTLQPHTETGSVAGLD
jgi:putative transposase